MKTIATAINQQIEEKISTLLVFTLIILTLAGFTANLQANENLKIAKALSAAFADVAENAAPAVVHVKTEQELETGSSRRPRSQEELFRKFFGPDAFGQSPFNAPRSFKRRAQGSGFIIDAKGTVITNNHVVDNSKKVEIVLPDKRIFEAEVLGADPKSDLAVLRVKDTKGAKLPHVKLGNSDKLRIGELVMAIGAPFGLSKTVTTGIVSAVGRDVGMAAYENYIQTDAAINPGNSGGPLFNLDGEVIGINTAISSASGGNNGVGFAIPVNMAKNIIDQLVDSGEVTRGWIGVGIQDIESEMEEMFEGYDKKGGVIISQVGPDMPADKAGIKAGDVILEFNGKRTADTKTLRYLVANAPVNKKAKVKILRKGKILNLTITPAKQPERMSLKKGDSSPEEEEEEVSDLTEKFGIKVQELTESMAEKFGYETLSGVLVSSVMPGSYAADKGLRPGTLIVEIEHTPVKDIASFLKVLKKAEGKGRVLFRIISGDAARYIVLKKEEKKDKK
ncbi:MAG: Do family serine endopeptidase, partial [Planctomycetota bacterium]